jgi:hypothetical protein
MLCARKRRAPRYARAVNVRPYRPRPAHALYARVAYTASLVSLASCATSGAAQSSQGSQSGVTPRERGCAIELMREGIPTQSVRVLATVRARCTGEIAADRSRCERLLMDEGCQRGAVVLWQLREAPLRDTEDGITLEASAGVYR